MVSSNLDCGRLTQIFSAKLVLEVFGGAGAIWGFSEAATLRYPETNEFWRTNALSVGFIFFIRFLLQIRDYISQRNPDEGRDMWIRLSQVFAAKLVLEVFGGAGAIWGFSEVLTLRNPETQEQWRFNALFIGGVFGIRYLLQIKDFVMKINGHVSNLDEDRSFVRFVQIFSAKLVLEVFGGGGAIWGFSESLTLRNPETQELWRFWAASAGFIFFIRFLLQIVDHMHERNGLHTFGMDGGQWVRLVQIFSARLVLEVFGGAGAIWGFSEALTLRNPVTQEFWRFNALSVGFIFFIRFFLQINDYLHENKDSTYDKLGMEVRSGFSETVQVI